MLRPFQFYNLFSVGLVLAMLFASVPVSADSDEPNLLELFQQSENEGLNEVFDLPVQEYLLCEEDPSAPSEDSERPEFVTARFFGKEALVFSAFGIKARA